MKALTGPCAEHGCSAQRHGRAGRSTIEISVEQHALEARHARARPVQLITPIMAPRARHRRRDVLTVTAPLRRAALDRAARTSSSWSRSCAIAARQARGKPVTVNVPEAAQARDEALGEGAIRHFGVPSAFTTGRPGLTMSAVKAVYQKICWAMAPCAGTGPDS